VAAYRPRGDGCGEPAQHGVDSFEVFVDQVRLQLHHAQRFGLRVLSRGREILTGQNRDQYQERQRRHHREPPAACGCCPIRR